MLRADTMDTILRTVFVLAGLAACSAGPAQVHDRGQEMDRLRPPLLHAGPVRPGAGAYVLEVGGVKCGPVAVAGDVVGDLVDLTPGAPTSSKRPAGPVTLEPLAVVCPLPLAPALAAWVAAAPTPGWQRKDGAILTVGARGDVLARVEFLGGVITEIGFPAADSDGKAAGELVLRIQAMGVRFSRPGGKCALPAGPAAGTVGCRLAIDGLDTSALAGVEAFALKGSPQVQPVGGVPQWSPGYFTVPDVFVTLPVDGAGPWFDLFERQTVLRQGSNQPGNEGTLTLQDAGGKALLTLRLHRCGILRMGPAPAAEGGGAQVRAGLYVSYMELHFPAPAGGR